MTKTCQAGATWRSGGRAAKLLENHTKERTFRPLQRGRGLTASSLAAYASGF
jgi:hypothetical protein